MNATCHPNEKHFAKGLCAKCYNAQKQNKRYWATDETKRRKYRKERYEITTGPPRTGDRLASCHPDRRHYAKGLCFKCYDNERHKVRYPAQRDRYIAQAKARYVKNKRKIFWRALQTKFGITQEQYETLFAKQKGKCAICAGALKDVRREYFCVDHDHTCCKGKKSCGKCVRGLLCLTCNAGLGQFNDNADLLEKAAAYLHSTRLMT